MKVLIIIPAYNEEESIEKVINNLKQNYSQYDYVIINDGSHDHTSEICHKNKYKIIDLPVNLGLTGAFQTGLKYAYKKGYDYAIQFDADGQHLPEYIPAMVDKIEEGYDMVIGSRFVEKPKPRSLRMLGSRVISTAIKITTGVHIADPTSGMRLFNKTLIREFAENINYEPEPDTVSFLIKQGVKVAEVQVEMKEREAGESYLNLSRSIVYMTKMFVSIIILQNFRVVLILCSLFTAIFIIRKIRQSKVQINYAIFWILFSACLLIFSVFPELSISLASLLGIYSSTNFIFLVILFAVIIKLFFNTIEISNLEYKIKELSQKIAIDEKDFNETKENKSEEEMDE